MAVASSGIVEGIDVRGDFITRQRSILVDLLLDMLLLQATEERLSDCVVPTVAPTTHAWDQAVVPTEALPVIASVLGSLI